MEKYLPLGSIVTLENGNKKIMICGRIQEHVEQQQLYDYCACLYPEGIIDPKELYLFNNNQIDRVYFIGMQDEDEFAFRDFMEKQLTTIHNK